MRVPDHRYTTARRLLSDPDVVPKDDFVSTLLDHLNPKVNFCDESITRALSLYENAYKRSNLESYLLGASLEEASKTFELDIEVVSAFATYFFDVSLFEDKLTKFEYVSSLPTGEDKERKRWVLSLGKEFIDWRFGNAITLNSDEILRRLLTDAYVMARHSMSSGKTTSKDVKESFRWASLAARIADVLAKRVVDEEEEFNVLEITAIMPGEDFEGVVDLDDLEIIRG